MFFGIIPTVFGVMYGYTPLHKRTPSDALKFAAIYTPLVYIKMVNQGLDETMINMHIQRSKVSPAVSSLVLAPLFTGWFFCIGSAMGRYGRERLTGGEAGDV